MRPEAGWPTSWFLRVAATALLYYALCRLAVALGGPDLTLATLLMRLAVLLPGCVLLGALSRSLRGPAWEGSAVVFVVTILVLTESYRVYVLDYIGGPPSFAIAFRDTALWNAPSAAAIAAVPLLGWYWGKRNGTRQKGRSHV